MVGRFKRYSVSKVGEMIEVKLSDTAFNLHFRAKAHTSNKKEMIQLKEDLKNKGVDFDKIENKKIEKNWYG